ncbi:MAG: hypothetical protein QM731_08690 [Chitinophagaceae bacterium]
MRPNRLQLASVITFFLLMAACSPRLSGTWTVQRFETSQPGQPGVTLTNIGTLTFKGQGQGEKNIRYSVLGVTRDDQSIFSWEWHDGVYVTIEGSESEFAKTWIVMVNKKKYQKWKSTDGGDKVQVLELSK